MALTYVVNDDLSVTILNDGDVFLVQEDDPSTPGFDAFASTAAASAWAEAAIVRYEAEMAAEAASAVDANAAAAAALEAELEKLGFDGNVVEVEE